MRRSLFAAQVALAALALATATRYTETSAGKTYALTARPKAPRIVSCDGSRRRGKGERKRNGWGKLK